MKQLISVLVAAVFAAMSVAAVAQDKKADPDTKKAKTTQKAKASGDKAAKPAKTAKKTQKKGEDAKK